MLEINAVGVIKAIHRAEVLYYFDRNRYATSFAEINTVADPKIEEEKDGYRFTIKSSGSDYSITAVPAIPGSTGNRSFYSDQSMDIRQERGSKIATASSPLLNP